MYNAMTQAFIDAGWFGFQGAKELNKLPKFQEGWSLKTSYKTYQVLKHQGIAK